MRKMTGITRLIAILMISLLLLTGCGDGGNGTGKGKGAGGVNDVLEKGMAAEDQKKSGESGTEQGNQSGQGNPDDSGNKDDQQGGQGNPEDQGNPGGQDNPDDSGKQGGQGDPGDSVSYDTVDIDLTELSDTVVYAEVYGMLMKPQDYLGKVVKMDGVFGVAVNTETNEYYYLCLVQDATACCALDIEFVLDGEHTFPNDYPELETNITVVGVFDTYEEDGNTYCTLRRAKLL